MKISRVGIFLVLFSVAGFAILKGAENKVEQKDRMKKELVKRTIAQDYPAFTQSLMADCMTGTDYTVGLQTCTGLTGNYDNLQSITCLSTQSVYPVYISSLRELPEIPKNWFWHGQDSIDQQGKAIAMYTARPIQTRMVNEEGKIIGAIIDDSSSVSGLQCIISIDVLKKEVKEPAMPGR